MQNPERWLSLQKSSYGYTKLSVSPGVESKGNASNLGRSGVTFLFFGLRVLPELARGVIIALDDDKRIRRALQIA